VAHLNFHVAEGLAIGTAIGVVPLARAWLGARPVATPMARLAVIAIACAAWACAPLGNLALGRSSIDARVSGGELVGDVAIAAWFVALYLVVLLALRRARKASGGNAS
jgi:hypothetical protein